VADIHPSARVRSRPGSVMAVTRASAAGMAHAAPRPARARPARSGAAARDTPASSEPGGEGAETGDEQAAAPEQVGGAAAHE
jgi:hypothetical protein